MGRDDYVVTRRLRHHRRVELLGLPTHARAAHGLFLALQYPVELPGVRVDDFLDAALRGQGRAPDDVRARVVSEAERLGVAQQFLDRGLNVEFSGGEQKRAETLQLAVLRPKFAVLDEIDSGLDVDALRDVARRVETMTNDDGLGVLAITTTPACSTSSARRRARADGRARGEDGWSGTGAGARGDGLRGLAAALGVRPRSTSTPAPTTRSRPGRLLRRRAHDAKSSCSIANATAASRECTPSLARMFWMCVRAVEYVMPIASAICLPLSPRTSRSSTSTSRSVRNRASSSLSRPCRAGDRPLAPARAGAAGAVDGSCRRSTSSMTLSMSSSLNATPCAPTAARAG